jgi:hypothetical protein
MDSVIPSVFTAAHLGLCVNPLPQTLYMYNAQYNKTLNVMYICLLVCSPITQGAFKFQFSAHCSCTEGLVTSVIQEDYLMPHLLA